MVHPEDASRRTRARERQNAVQTTDLLKRGERALAGTARKPLPADSRSEPGHRGLEFDNAPVSGLEARFDRLVGRAGGADV